jgi:hypothetical protein
MTWENGKNEALLEDERSPLPSSRDMLVLLLGTVAPLTPLRAARRAVHRVPDDRAGSDDAAVWNRTSRIVSTCSQRSKGVIVAARAAGLRYMHA